MQHRRHVDPLGEVVLAVEVEVDRRPIGLPTRSRKSFKIFWSDHWAI